VESVPKKEWSDFSPAQKQAVYVGGVIELVVTAAALRDVARRPASAVRGPKAAWVVALFVQPFGPLAYFAAGRR
jgi:hypothetical protein